MSAKEMFKNLGFTERMELYKNDELKEIKFYNDGTWITISKDRIQYIENRNNSNLPLKLLKAINQQCKELEWLDEEI